MITELKYSGRRKDSFTIKRSWSKEERNHMHLPCTEDSVISKRNSESERPKRVSVSKPIPIRGHHPPFFTKPPPAVIHHPPSYATTPVPAPPLKLSQFASRTVSPLASNFVSPMRILHHVPVHRHPRVVTQPRSISPMQFHLPQFPVQIRRL